MLQRSISFLVVLIFTFSGEIFAQKHFVEKKSVYSGFSLNNMASYHLNTTAAGRNPFLTNSLSLPAVADIRPAPYCLPKNLFVQQLGFVCKKEWQLQKATSIPFRFRLGSLAYTDYMEQKPNALKPQ